MNYYELLGIPLDTPDEEVKALAFKGYSDKIKELRRERNEGKITAEIYNSRIEELEEARDVLVDDELRKDYDYQTFEQPSRKKGLFKKLAIATGAVALVGSLAVCSFCCGNNLIKNKDSKKTNANNVTYEEEYYPVEDKNEETTKVQDNVETVSENSVETTDEKVENIANTEKVYYGDINDKTLIKDRATKLYDELMAMNIINPTSGAVYSVEEIEKLIKYANGVYTPESMEEIDVLHLNLLNLLISPLNTDPYLYHIVYASGNDEFKDLAIETSSNIKTIDFANAFGAYESNGVYPLTLWMQQKREQIYKLNDRNEINKIYVEVGQVVADVMKGNGATITIYDDKQVYTYTYTSEQILANHASAMLFTIEAQLIFANKYEIRDENEKVIQSSQTEWEVYNKFNDSEVPDIVTLEEMEAWINNGCDYEWAIDSVLINGQTFGQRVQGDLEGMAQNNYAMNSNKTLTK